MDPRGQDPWSISMHVEHFDSDLEQAWMKQWGSGDIAAHKGNHHNGCSVPWPGHHKPNPHQPCPKGYKDQSCCVGCSSSRARQWVDDNKGPITPKGGLKQPLMGWDVGSLQLPARCKALAWVVVLNGAGAFQPHPYAWSQQWSCPLNGSRGGHGAGARPANREVV